MCEGFDEDNMFQFLGLRPFRINKLHTILYKCIKLNFEVEYSACGLLADISKVNHQITIDFHWDEARQLEGFNMLYYCWRRNNNTIPHSETHAECPTSASFSIFHSTPENFTQNNSQKLKRDVYKI